MKKFLGGLTMILALAFTLPGAVLAQKNQSGVYVAPRFIYGITDMDRMQVKNSEGKFKMNSDTDSAFGGSFAVGYNFNPKFKVPMRAELEYSAFSKAKGKRSFFKGNDAIPSLNMLNRFEQEVGVQTIFVNFYYDEKTSTPLTPYLTAGLGIAIVDSKAKEDHFEATSGTFLYSGHGPSETDVNFAWNVGLGLAYDFSPNFSMDIGYRYADLGSAKTKRAYSIVAGQRFESDEVAKIGDLTMHQFHMGARYTF